MRHRDGCGQISMAQLEMKYAHEMMQTQNQLLDIFKGH
jgi:hypothetical protein